jgi:hypothetical protein
LDQLGTKEQKDKFLVGFADGTHVGCFGISEPGKQRFRNEYANNMVGVLESVLCIPYIQDFCVHQNYSVTLRITCIIKS